VARYMYTLWVIRNVHDSDALQRRCFVIVGHFTFSYLFERDLVGLAPFLKIFPLM
jgi:hypothetical protein